MSVDRLSKAVQGLCSALKGLGKDQPAEYFERLLGKVVNPTSFEDRESALAEFISSGKLADLADFNPEEDHLFDLVHLEARNMKS